LSGSIFTGDLGQLYSGDDITARSKLSEALIHLKCTIDVMLAVIKEKK
jgi:hypothetical protein